MSDWGELISDQEARDRGVTDLLDELRRGPSVSRGKEIRHFLAACKPTFPRGFAFEWDLRIASMADLRQAGRISESVHAAGESVSVDGRTISDINLDLVDLSGGHVFSNQTAMVPHAWLIVEEMRHMNHRWLERGALDPRTGPVNLINLHPMHRTARLSLDQSPLKLPDNNIYFVLHGLVGTTSFAHFLVDLLGQLILLDHVKQLYGDKVVPVLTSPHWFRFKWPGMSWLFEKLVGPETNILHLEGECRAQVTRGFTTSRVVRGDVGLSFAAIRYVRDRMTSVLTVSSATRGSPYVYVSRKDAGDREVANINAVEALLARKGFRTILIEQLTPQEAYDAVASAEVIIGMHGSGLMYHFYASPGATIIELAFPSTMWTVILSTAAVLGHNPIRIRNVDGDADLVQLSDVLNKL